MSLLWVDGFDTYGGDSASIIDTMPTGKYISGGGTQLRASGTTRSGYGFSVRLYGASIRKAFLPQADLTVGVAYYHATSLGEYNDDSIIQFEIDDLRGNRTEMCTVYVNGVGGITVLADGTDVFVTSVPNIVFPATWHYIECKYVPRSSTHGEIHVRVDNAAVCSFVGVTSGHGDVINVIALPHEIGGETNGLAGINYAYYDDLYVLNSQGVGPCNEFLGDVIAYVLHPNADTATNEGTPSTPGAAHFTLVNEIVGNGIGTLVLDTDGQAELFGMTTVPADAIDILAVQISVRAKKDVSGICGFNIIGQVDANQVIGPERTLAGSYINQELILEAYPGGGAWSPANIADLECGFQAVI